MCEEGERNLRPIWDALLAVYDEVKKACEKHGIRYYASSGTALGAVRHGGFIPWDDDLDLIMPREDYDRFLANANQWLPNYLRVNSIHSDKTYEVMWLKVQDTRREVFLRFDMKELDLYSGAFIDVFPIDGIPKSFLLKRWYVFRRIMWLRVIGCDSTTGFKGVMLKFIRFVFLMGRNANESRCKFDRWLSKFRYDSCVAVDYSCAPLKRLKKLPYTRGMFGDPVIVKFDRTEVPLPYDYDAYLRGTYGDYMKLPPPEQRVPTHRVK